MPKKKAKHGDTPVRAEDTGDVADMQFQPDLYYKITLSGPVKVRGQVLKPGSQSIVVSGRIAEQIRHAITSAVFA